MPEPTYLTPYLNAAARHGGNFGSLLWASPATQSARFTAFTRLFDFTGRTVLDVGCGRADFLDHLVNLGMTPADYSGLEAVEPLARAAELKHHRNCRILRGDFVQDPIRLFVGAEAVVFSGSLNTLDESVFHSTLKRAWDAAAEALLFNFLASPDLAAAEFLTWHHRAEVEAFARTLSVHVDVLEDYLPGDCTILVRKPSE